MSDSSSLSHRPAPITVAAINIYEKQNKDDVVDVIFDETTPIELSDIISDFIADKFNHLPTLFTVLQLKCVCRKVRQLSTNAHVETILMKLKYSPAKTKFTCMNFLSRWKGSERRSCSKLNLPSTLFQKLALRRS
jgi:hypothetical protein